MRATLKLPTFNISEARALVESNEIIENCIDYQNSHWELVCSLLAIGKNIKIIEGSRYSRYSRKKVSCLENSILSGASPRAAKAYIGKS